MVHWRLLELRAHITDSPVAVFGELVNFDRPFENLILVTVLRLVTFTSVLFCRVVLLIATGGVHVA